MTDEKDKRIADLEAKLAVAREALKEFVSEYDGFEDGDGNPCPTLQKARTALNTIGEDHG